MKNIETVYLILANIGAWTFINLTDVELLLKVVLLILSIIIAVRKLISKRGRDAKF